MSICIVIQQYYVKYNTLLVYNVHILLTSDPSVLVEYKNVSMSNGAHIAHHVSFGTFSITAFYDIFP